MAEPLRDLLTRIVSRERHRGTVLLDAEDLCAIETALAQAEPVQQPFALPCPTPKACREHCCSGHCIPRATSPQQAEPVQPVQPVAFDPNKALRLADEYADLAADVRAKQGYPDHAVAHDRKLRDEARAALEAYLSRQAEPVEQQAEPDLRFANPIMLTPPQKEMQRRQLAHGIKEAK